MIMFNGNETEVGLGYGYMVGVVYNSSEISMDWGKQIIR